MTGPKIEKKIILTTNFYGETEQAKMDKSRSIAKSHETHATYVPGLTPTATDMITKIDDVISLMAKRTQLIKDIRQTTEQIVAGIDSITGDITSKWAPQTQAAIGKDIDKALVLGYGIKGKTDGHAEPVVSVTNSKPVFSRVELNMTLQHAIYFTNSLSENGKLPKDAASLDLYETFDEANVGKLKKMSYLGKVKKGKFINSFSTDDLGKTVYYLAVYVPKKAGVAPSVSNVESAIVV